MSKNYTVRIFLFKYFDINILYEYFGINILYEYFIYEYFKGICFSTNCHVYLSLPTPTPHFTLLAINSSRPLVTNLLPILIIILSNH